MWVLMIPVVALLLALLWSALRGRPNRGRRAIGSIEGYRRMADALERPVVLSAERRPTPGRPVRHAPEVRVPEVRPVPEVRAVPEVRCAPEVRRVPDVLRGLRRFPRVHIPASRTVGDAASGEPTGPGVRAAAEAPADGG
jgi:hypothetical protein